MTAKGDLLDEIRHAYCEAGLSAEQTYRMVTDSAADVLRLPEGAGRLQVGGYADLIAVRDDGASPCEALVQLRPETLGLVMVRGEPELLSSPVASRWPRNSIARPELLRIGGVERLVGAPIMTLIRQARKCLGDELRLGGRLIAS
jgi:hypothetical protein